MTERILITGANRGIGYELARQYLAQGDTEVFAACRTPERADALHRLDAQHPGRLVIVPLEVTDAAAIASAVQTVQQHTPVLDILINNAGIEPPDSEQSWAGVNVETMTRVFQVNSVAPLMIAKAFSDLLAKAKTPRIINISSQMGSIAHRDYGGQYAYCTSKAALNMITRAMAADLRQMIVVALDPGWVQTDMGGSSASLTPDDSARGILKVVGGLGARDSGSYLRWNGSTLPW